MWKIPLIAAYALLYAIVTSTPLQAQTNHSGQPPVVQILYHESVQWSVQASAQHKTQQDGNDTLTLTFHAFDQDFTLLLTTNDQLLANLSEQQRENLQAKLKLYRGKIEGIEDSWVRLSQQDGEWSGMIWDGSEMYVIDSPEQISASQLASQPSSQPNNNALTRQTPDKSANPMIYRLSDTIRRESLDEVLVVPGAESDIPGASSDTVGHDAYQGSENQQYQALVDHLKSLSGAPAAAAALNKLDMALVADTQFVSNHNDPQAQILIHMNVIDGIYSEQVGVQINIAELQLLDDNSGLTSSDPGSLLGQFGSYVNSSITNPGLAHLFTGRDLDGGVVGIAYLNVLCNSRYGIGLSQTVGLGSLAALVIAHELGHNFGAPHDNQSNTACASTPGDYLMNPFINGSDQFSQCSLEQIQPNVERASCLTPISSEDSDLTLTLPAGPVVADVNETVALSVSVNNTGAAAAQSARLTINLGDAIAVQQLASGCSQQGNNVNCDLNGLGANASVAFDFNLQGQQPGQFTVVAQVSAANDSNSANNSREVIFQFEQIVSEADLIVNAVKNNFVAEVGTPLEYKAEISNHGQTSALSASATISVPSGLSIDSINSDVGSCVKQTTQASCQFGDIAVDEKRTVTVSLQGQQPGDFSATMSASASNDGNTANNSQQLSVTVNAAPAPEPPPEPPVTELTNGSFEEFTISRNYGRWALVRLPGWKVVESSQITEADKQNGIDISQLTKDIDAELWAEGVGLKATHGLFKIELDGQRRNVDALVQTFTTEAGVNYTLKFDAYARRDDSSQIELWIDGYFVKAITPNRTWQTFSHSFTGTGQSQSVMFRELASENDSRGAVLDYVRLSSGSEETHVNDGADPSVTGTIYTQDPEIYVGGILR